MCNDKNTHDEHHHSHDSEHQCHGHEHGHGHGHGHGHDHDHGHGHGHGHVHGHGHGHHDDPTFTDPEKWLALLESEERISRQKPHEVLRVLNLQSTSEVADIGAGTGFFSMKFAKIATSGTVYAIDLEPRMVEFLKERMIKENLPNVVSLLGKYDSPNIPRPVDLIFICAVYHHMQDRVTYFTNLKSSLKDNGTLCIIDWKKGPAPNGPPDHMKLSAEEVTEELEKAGYKLEAKPEVDMPNNYLLLFKKVGN